MTVHRQALGTILFGNIIPYRKDLQARVTNDLPQNVNFGDMAVLISIAKDGGLISTEVSQSSGSTNKDKVVLSAVRKTQFAPLPEWYHGDHLTFRIEPSKCKSQE